MYIARQPILNNLRAIAGYELLFRTDGEPIGDGVLATATVAAKAFADPAFANILGPHRGFINVDGTFLLSDLVEFLPPGRTVLEVLETVEFTPAIVERLTELKAKGYWLATDDFVGDHQAIAPALALLDIVKVDVPGMNGADVSRLRHQLRGKTLLAEKVETQNELLRYSGAGFSLFQGYYFARPEIQGRTKGDPARAAALGPLALLEQDASDAKIEDALKRHPDLVVGLLRLVNSAAAGLTRPIDSMRQAMMHLGRRQMRLWLQLLVYLGSAGGDPAANPLLQVAAVRAKTMESLARAMGASGESAFLTGLVSLFDVAVGMTKDEVAKRLALDPEIAQALSARTGTLGALLELAESLERADGERVRCALTALPALGPDDLFAASDAALRWAGQLGAPAH